ncbi:hypothetical protein AX16_010348 [Volvariella volvacea WC 439]|nr:hypothetical protein AX16_010348 [Volvariella volvacea WC 439]
MPPGRATRPSQTQTQTQTQYSSRAGPSQKRSIRGRRVEEDEEEEEEEEDGEGEMMDVDGDGGDGPRDETEADVTRRANDLARLLLFYEHRRIPVRRDEISKKVMGAHSRGFNAVLEKARKILLYTFGYEIVELPSRAGIEQTQNPNANNDELEEGRNAAGMKKKATATGSKQYILRSALDAQLIALASQSDVEIRNQEVEDIPPELEDDDDLRPVAYGSLISWSQGEQVGAVGILYIVLALILVNGRVISDADLQKRMRQLNLVWNSPVLLTPHSTHQSLTFEQHLGALIRQGYLEHHQSGGESATRGGKGKSSGGGGGGAGGGAGTKRMRSAATQTQGADEGGGGAEGGVTYEWRWGVRAHCEIGEMAVAEFIAEFMVKGGGGDGDDDDGNEDEEDGGAGPSSAVARTRARAGNGQRGGEQSQSLAKGRIERMREGIVKAAGGNLTDVNKVAG